jgi:diacylglycerol kinase (ATP)
MKAKVILNPYSARWDALRRQPEAEAALQAAGVAYEVAVTERPGQGVELARAAVEEGFSPLIAAGGDGHIGDVVNGIAQACEAEPWTPLGILPLGTANDLVDNLNLPLDLPQAAEVIAQGNTIPIDVLKANERLFVNNAGLGLEPHITIVQSGMTRVRGIVRYLLAALVGISHNPRWNMEIEWQEGAYSGPTTLVSIGNCARTGGVFYIVPHADPFDGLITFIYGFLPTRRQILQILPRTMNPKGSHVAHPDVHEIHTTWLRVRATPPTPMHADGEVISQEIDEIEYGIIPAALPILLAEKPPKA